MEYTGRLITGDFEDNTMTFEIEGEMILQAGRYKIVQIEVGNQVKNNVALADISDLCCSSCGYQMKFDATEEKWGCTKCGHTSQHYR